MFFLHLCDVDQGQLTPAMKQYADMKKEHPDFLLFFQMGDFYELFFEDAHIVSKELGLALTHRGRAGDYPIPMCGVPLHASTMYLARLLQKNFCIALCDQQETPEAKQGKGLLTRAITRKITPATATEALLLTTPLNNFLMVVKPDKKNIICLCLVDVSTGEVFLESSNTNNILQTHLTGWNPAEILLPFEAFEAPFAQKLKNLYKGRLRTWPKIRFNNPTATLEAIYGPIAALNIKKLSSGEALALRVACDYVKSALGKLPTLQLPEKADGQKWIAIDTFTRKNLDLFESTGQNKEACLFNCLNATSTPGGKRLLAQRLQTPLCDKESIEDRLDIVAFFLDNRCTRASIQNILSKLSDAQRALRRLVDSKTSIKTSPKDLEAIKNTLLALPQLVQEFQKCLDSKNAENTQKRIAKNYIQAFSQKNILCELLHTALQENLPHAFEAGKVIRPAYDDTLKNLSHTVRSANEALLELQRAYQEKLALPQLRIKFNNLIGHHIEVPRKQICRLTDAFVLRQGLASTSRYTTNALVDLASRINTASERLIAYEQTLFQKLVCTVSAQEAFLTPIIQYLAQLDVETTLAHIAQENNYVRPTLSHKKVLNIKKGRHPILERTLKDGFSKNPAPTTPQNFSPNCLHLSPNKAFALFTAPNMAGKSTFLRQNALIVLMAHIGSFVPAQEATVGLVDKIFSRLGASDDITQGHSTFMLEMLETAHILNYASSRSFVILDEVGRGTSTHDGLAIARSCIHYLVEKITCRCLFATHYVELTNMKKTLPGIENYTLEVRPWEKGIAFLHRVIQGETTHTYGIEIARLAGLPADVIDKAQTFRNQLTNTTRPSKKASFS